MKTTSRRAGARGASPHGHETARKRAPGAGRPPAGDDGARVKDYPRVPLRLPPDIAAALKAWSEVVGRPQWRLVAESIGVALERLKGDDAEDVARLAKRYRDRYKAPAE